MITALAHACFLVSDLERSVHFYSTCLGLRQAFDFRDGEGGRTGAYLHVGGRAFIELFQKKHAPFNKDQSYQHLCLEVDDIHASVDAIRSRGISVSDPLLGDDQSWQAWIVDPDGNFIELHCYTPQSRQAPHLG